MITRVSRTRIYCTPIQEVFRRQTDKKRWMNFEHFRKWKLLPRVVPCPFILVREIMYLFRVTTNSCLTLMIYTSPTIII